MDASSLRALIEAGGCGRCAPDDAVRQLRRLPYSPTWASPGSTTIGTCARGCPKRSTGRARRPSTVRPWWWSSCSAADGPVLLTRATEAQVKAVTRRRRRPRASARARCRESGPLATVVFRPAPPRAGPSWWSPPGRPTSRSPPSARPFWARSGSLPTLLIDCGVAGLHRLLAEVDTLAMADAVVVIAGMEGALASVVGGLTPAPVVAVPTSTGLRRRARGCHRTARHAVRLLVRDHRRRASTTATAPPAPSPGSAVTTPATGPARWRGSTASPASPATWRSARWSTPGADVDEVRAPPRPAGPARAGTSSSRRAAGRHRLHPRRGRGETTWWYAPTPTSPP